MTQFAYPAGRLRMETLVIENPVGTSTVTQVISSPPPLPPRFLAVRST
jgi:hypothetical protein